MGKSIVVTGGCGFIGKEIVRYLLRTIAVDDRIIIFDNLERHGMCDKTQELLDHECVDFVEIDLTDREALSRQTISIDRLYHLAAIVGVENVTQNPEKVLRVNTLSTLNVFEWFMQHKAPEARMLFSSSSEVYSGNLLAGLPCPVPTPENVPVTVNDIADPRFSYALSKAWGEAYVNYMAKDLTDNVVVSVRYHNVYGPDMGYQHVIPQIIKRIEARENPFRIIAAEQTRSFCWVADAAEATVRVLEADVKRGENLVHIGDPNGEIEIGKLYETLFSLCEWTPQETELIVPPIGSVARRCPDTLRLRKLIGDVPHTPLEEGLRKTFSAYMPA